MKTQNSIIHLLLLCLSSFSTFAQQDPMYTHYMNNSLSINPAYAGSRDALTVTLLHRSQWVAFKGAPITQTLTMHMPVANKHIGVGLSVGNDKIGPNNNTTASAQFAYILHLNERSKLSLGVNGGINILQSDLNTLVLHNQNDVTFNTNIANRVTPTFGVGAYYKRERFYAGVSVPNLVESNYSNLTLSNGTTFLGKSQRHYFFIAGALFKLADKLDLKPTTLVKMTAGAPVQVDLTASFIISDRFLIGAMVRSGDALGILVGFDITKQFHVGYSYDWSYGLRTYKYNAGSHEVFLRYDFIFKGMLQVNSPRYF
jgi:type IX secretion system PorP/SprF family membrane protein